MLSRYIRWLHTGWPAGTVERLPELDEEGRTAIPGVRVAGDLTGIPLLKFSADSGARAVQAILAEPDFVASRGQDPAVRDLVIVGGGVAGIAAAMEAKRNGLDPVVYEAAQPFNTIQNFPKQKPIYTYPTEMVPRGSLQVSASVKEALYDELVAQKERAGVTIEHAMVTGIVRQGDTLAVHLDGAAAPVRALRAIVAIGKSGNYRKLGIPGEERDKVYQRLYDPSDFAGKEVLVVGGGDSALETAIALASAGARVALSYRKHDFSRPKTENVEQVRALAASGKLKLLLATRVLEIGERDVHLVPESGERFVLPNEVVFCMIGREPPLDFFRRSGIPIRGEWRAAMALGFASFLAFCFFLYNWKAGGAINHYFVEHQLFPYNLRILTNGAFEKALSISLREPGFYYSLAYTLVVVLFGIARIRRRKTPYITVQTLTLMAVQVVPLFVIPYLLLPWAGHAGLFDHGIAKRVADELFPAVDYGQGREYWRAFGLVLAWPLFIWNFFTSKPMVGWLTIGAIQTFILIPVLIWRFGKGVYCGWICSCGALAETVGDRQRQKMPHGPFWNRLNLVGQVVLAFAVLLFMARVTSWYAPGTALGHSAQRFYDTLLSNNTVLGIPLDYYHVVDLFLAGIIGVGCYFWFSGRVWCRFACPLAALMHIYARFSRFRIFAEKKKCISCNVCTSVCHQGIDVMSFANRGLGMEDPECVRCSACVQACPTGTLSFGYLGKGGTPVYDRLAASPVLMTEGKRHLPILN